MVGTWVVDDAGDATTSDSDGKGIWGAEGDTVKGKWVEILADRTTHKFAGTLTLSYQLKVDHDTFSGTSNASFFDANGKRTGEAKPTAFKGKRVTLP